MIKAIVDRKSCRKYNGAPVDDAAVMQLLEAARLAPSGSNTQPWHFIIIRNEETKDAIIKADSNQQWMKGADVFIACVADIRCRLKDETDIFIDESCGRFETKQIIRDTACAIQNIMLEAAEMGLATCWTGAYKQADMRPILGVPNDKFIVGVITIGHMAEDRAHTPRKPLADMVRYEKW